jgi:hypothetical protein
VAATSCNGSQQLDPRQLRAVDLVALGTSESQAARELQVDRSTLWRWQQQPAFQDEIARRRAELWAHSLDRMPSLLDRALDVVADALDDGDRSVAIQLLRVLRAGDAALQRAHALADSLSSRRRRHRA